MAHIATNKTIWQDLVCFLYFWRSKCVARSDGTCQC